jgi:hypothetical protein
VNVKVTLVNAATGDVIGVSELPSDALPETFDGGAQLAIGDKKWGVVRAEPATRTEYERTGALRLTLALRQKVSPEQIRYTMPTICGDLPPVEPAPEDGNAALVLHEDLWRDIELVSSEQQDDIDDNLAAIARIEHDAAGADGYGDIHLRIEPSAPLDGVEIGIDELPGSRLPGGVVLSSAGGKAKVVDGFAFALGSGQHLYGWAPHGQIHTLALDAPLADGAIIDELTTRHQLVLVNWRTHG